MAGNDHTDDFGKVSTKKIEIIIIGPTGSGKTMLMDDIMQHLTCKGLIVSFDDEGVTKKDHMLTSEQYDPRHVHITTQLISESKKAVHSCDTYMEKLETILEYLESEIVPALRIIKTAIQKVDDADGHALLLQAVINRINDLAGDIDFSK